MRSFPTLLLVDGALLLLSLALPIATAACSSEAADVKAEVCGGLCRVLRIVTILVAGETDWVTGVAAVVAEDGDAFIFAVSAS